MSEWIGLTMVVQRNKLVVLTVISAWLLDQHLVIVWLLMELPCKHVYISIIIKATL